ncbi:helix-turn-helix domain-containing protein [uncultured Allomuricauda sp.]|uniref:helix-turn-helix domain-containing protein n=1 Tax=Flagellimonas sp. W118 TaxID=3410791 RepID=UPI00260C058C|nr:helix-turn-helix transcriptional regulator [uncultured Allomuricauda sp.]
MRAIKQLRRKKSMNQSQLAEVVGVSLRTIQNYEKKDANIPTKNLAKIAAHFDMSIPELYLQEVNEAGGTYAKRKTFIRHGCVFYPLDGDKYFVQIPLVLVDRQNNYIESLAESRLGNSPFKSGFIVEFLEEDPYKAFEISGDSMNDGTIHSIPNKTIVLGVKTKKEVFIKEINAFVDKTYILVCKNRIICKKITGYNGSQDTIQCQNLNIAPEYQDFDLPLSDILEVFRIVKKQL